MPLDDVSSGFDVEYDAPATVSSFMESDAFTRFVLGPVGSGKTTGCLFEMLRRSAAQAPGPDGIRRTRWAIVRNTLSQLKQTVLRDIETWLRPIINYRVSDNIIIVESGDVYSEWFLIPLAEPEDQKRLLSMQLTGVWINEFIELVPDLVSAMAGRVGRFPSAKQGGPSWFGIIGDSNMPNVGSEWHRLLDLDVPKDWKVFTQPGGLSPDAENLDWLVQTPETLKLPPGHPERVAQGRTYYERLSGQHSKAWVKRYVDAQFGDDPDGTAVWRETFAPAVHIARSVAGATTGGAPGGRIGGLMPIPGKTLIVGQDFGRNPCAVIAQVDARGRFCVLEEVISVDMGLELHLRTALRPALMNDRYAGMKVVVVGDPSGAFKGQLTEETCFDLLEREGFIGIPASTNDIEPRIRAVDSLLLARDGFIVDEARCPTLVRAMRGLYRFGKTKAGQTKPTPEKTNPWSDVADALQYAALTMHPAFQTVMGRIVARKTGAARRNPPPRITAKAWT